jgi:hypothetical protein
MGGGRGGQQAGTDVRARPDGFAHPIVLQRWRPLNGDLTGGHLERSWVQSYSTSQFRLYLFTCDRSRSMPHSTHHSSAASIA